MRNEFLQGLEGMGVRGAMLGLLILVIVLILFQLPSCAGRSSPGWKSTRRGFKMEYSRSATEADPGPHFHLKG